MYVVVVVVVLTDHFGGGGVQLPFDIWWIEDGSFP